MKKYLNLFLCFALIFSSFSIVGYSKGNLLTWPSDTEYLPTDNYSDKFVRFLPLDNYTVSQNPPDFLWRSISESVSYDLIVCRDENLTDIVYSKYDNENHFYNFSEPFEPGIYYWSVRYKTSNGTYSQWKEPSRFLVPDNAKKVYIEDTETIINKVKALKSPAYYNPEVISQVIKTSEGQSNYDSLKAKISRYKEQKIDTTLTYTYGEGGTALNNTFWNEVINKCVDSALNIAYIYAIDKDEESLNLLIDRITCLTQFSYPDLDANTDSYIADTLRGLAICYDTVKDVLNADLKLKVIDTVNNLAKKITDNLLKERGKSIWETNPSASHEWELGDELIVTAILMGEELDSYERIVEFLLPLYINITDANTIEDGIYQGGIGYSRYRGINDLYLLLKRADIIDLFEKPELKNRLNQHLYLWPTNETGPFGDESYYKPDLYASRFLNQYGILYNSGYAKWMYDEIGIESEIPWEYLYYNDSSVLAKAPSSLPKSKYFPDGGFAGLHSDLTDPDRVSLYFRSSWWGSCNHSHADQNSFVINAYGENLAIDSGFYPYYNSPHHAYYSRQTHAHNAITVNGRGQPTQDIDSEGKITAFLNHSEFDLVSGDATKAYKEDKHSSPATLNGAKRDIIYLRPDVFIVIDDLEALDNTPSTFEFWLNAEENITLTDDLKGAEITKGDAKLSARVVYPNVSGTKLTGYKGIDGIEYPKEVDFDTTNTPDPDQRNQQRVYFKTQAVNKTKMITTLDVYKNGETSEDIITEDKGNGILKLNISDGSVVYVNTSDLSEVAVDNIQFKGTAIVLKNNSIMLVNGTKLIKDEKTLIESETPVSVALGNDELYISSLDNDAEIKVYCPEVKSIRRIEEDLKTNLTEDINKNGVLYTTDNDYINFELYNGIYSFNMAVPTVASSYVFKGNSGKEGDEHLYTYIFSKISNPLDGFDYGIEAGGKWYSLLKDTRDKEEYNKALSSGYFAIGLADPDGILGSSYVVKPQIRLNNNIVSSADGVTIDSSMPEYGSDATLKSISLSNTESGSNAVLIEDITEGKFEYDLIYNSSPFAHKIVAETSDSGATVSITDATSENHKATVKVTSQNGKNTNIYTFNYKSLSDAGYSQNVKANSVKSAYNTYFSGNIYSNVTSRAYIYNGTKGKSVAVLSFDISALSNITTDAILSVRNRFSATEGGALTLNVYGTTGNITSQDYDTVSSLKDKLLSVANVYASKNGYYSFNIDKDYIIEKVASGDGTLTLIIESDTVIANDNLASLMSFYNKTDDLGYSLLYCK